MEQQEIKHKINNIEKYKDDLKYNAFFYAKIVALEIVNFGAAEFVEANLYAGKIKTLALVITSFIGVSSFSLTLFKSIKSYLNYLKLDEALIKKNCSKELMDLLIQMHLEDTDSMEREKNL